MKSILALCLVAVFCGSTWAAKNDNMVTDHHSSDKTPAVRLSLKQKLLPKKLELLNKVKVAVYYESLCPDSKQFITAQLAPAWRHFQGYFMVKLVPYGNSTHEKVNGKWQFTCHHGPDECYGNKIQACILKNQQLGDIDKMDLVICLMSQPNPDKALDMCLVQVKKESESNKIKRCASSKQGNSLMVYYGNMTDTIQKPLSFVPTIVINETCNEENHSEALGNLKAVICRVAETKPSVC